jgi:N-acetyl-gamma-glutamyl-phosphate reductase
MPGNKPSIFIDGEAGAIGVAIRTLLEPRLDVLLKSLPADLRKNPSGRRDMMAEVDVVVLCLPDDAAREAAVMADELDSDALKVLDASTAHRVDPDWTYGFPEMTNCQAERIAAARKVANPGCYPPPARLLCCAPSS